ncbi:MAG: class I SAM-dependent methyltransferase [Pseudomonadota bacterium]
MLGLLPQFDRPRLAVQAGALHIIYDRAATRWQDGISKLGFLGAYSDLMHAIPTPPQTLRVMDIGTGTGAFAHAWIGAHGTPRALTLTDISPAMLDAAASRLTAARTITAPLGPKPETLPHQDVVLCAHVIEHLEDPDTALRWLFDHLAPGGLLVMAISKPHWCTALVRWRWGNAAFSPDTGRRMLAAAGFTEITARPFASGPPSRVSHGYTAKRP